MFNSRNRDAGPQAASPTPPSGNARRQASTSNIFSVIGPDVTVTGNIVAESDLHVDGRVEGDVACGALTLGTEGAIQGAVTGETARIAGSVEGAVRARQLIVERTARIAGDIEYETITIESGGQIDGALRRVTSLSIAPTPALLTSEATAEEAEAA